MSKRRDERIRALVEALAARRVLRLREAAALVGASEMTVRRDIEGAPDRFAYFGGHIFPTDSLGGGASYQLEQEADSHAAAKALACGHATELIKADTTVFIDCGTTLVHMAEAIPNDLPLTVICYSLNVAQRLAHMPRVRLIMLGGTYYPASASFSAEGGEPLKHFGIDQAFISAGGVDLKRGASCSHLHEVPVKKMAMQCALESHLIVDSSKLGRVRPMVFASLESFRMVITELGPAAPAALA